MDKYEYQLRLDQLKNLVAQKDYETAAEIANSINWNKVRNSKTLMMVAEVYDALGQYEPCKEVLLQAYDHSTIGRNIVSRLTEAAIKAKNVNDAEAFYNEFLEVAPKDNQRYVLAYKISCLKDAPLTDRIAILEEFKEKEYTEMWAYELAALYGQAGMREKCVETCDELILWFGEGEFVEKALDLKRGFQPLTPAQEKKYQRFRSKKGMVEISVPKKTEDSEDDDLPEITVTASKFNTQNLQDELAKSMEQIMSATEKETVTDTMDNIKKIVNDIPYLQSDTPEEEAAIEREKFNEEVDEGLRSDFQELLGEETDGQLSLQIPEETIREQQVAGQMSIEEVLAEWEKTKRAAEAAIAAAEQKKLDMAKEQALAEASEIMERLKALFPVLSATPGEDIPEKPETVADTLVPTEDDVQNQTDETEPEADLDAEPSDTEADSDAGLSDAAEPEEDEFFISGIGNESEEDAEDAFAVQVEGAAALGEDADAPEEPEAVDAAPAEDVPENTQDSMADVPDSEEDSQDAAADVPDSMEDAQESAEDMQDVLTSETREMPVIPDYERTVTPAEEQTATFEEPEEDAELQKILAVATQAMLENSDLEIPVSGGMAPEDMPFAEQTELPDIIMPEDLLETPGDTVEDVEEAPEDMENPEEDVLAEASVPEDVPAADDAEDIEESSEAEEPQEAEDSAEEISPEETMPDESAIESAVDSDDFWGEPAGGEEPADAEEPSEEEPQEDGIMTPEEREMFSYFLPVPGMEEQILSVLNDAPRDIGHSITSLRGNLIVQGEEGSGKTVLATSLIKTIQRIAGKEDTKIGKISAEALNRKDFAALIPKMQGGFLIVDKAGDLTAETVARMSRVMEQNTQGLVVILEDDSAGIRRALGLDFSFAKKFTGKVKIPIFTIDELVDFGKSYANEMECTIEEMGVLALYNRINNIQKLDHATSLAEVKDIVDQAIENAESGGIKKLFAKKYDENDYLILREKDFE